MVEREFLLGLSGLELLFYTYCGREAFVSRAHSQVNDTTEPNHTRMKQTLKVRCYRRLRLNYISQEKERKEDLKLTLTLTKPCYYVLKTALSPHFFFIVYSVLKLQKNNVYLFQQHK